MPLDFEADECLDCKVKYTSTLRSSLSILALFWSLGSLPVTGTLFLYKGQPDNEVWLFIAALFIISFIVMFVIYYSKKHKMWNEKEAKKDQIKYYAIMGVNISLLYVVFNYFQ